MISGVQMKVSTSSRRELRALCMALLVLAMPEAAKAQAWTAPTTAESVAIMLVVRAVVNAELGPPVEFEISASRMLEGWAYIDAVPKRAEGERFYYEETRYAEAVEFGRFEERVQALLKHSELGWILFEYSIGGGEEIAADWTRDYEVPDALFAPAP
jgi:hypothetical protein